MFSSPLYHMSVWASCSSSPFSSLQSLSRQRSTLGLKTSPHILLVKANLMAKPGNNGKTIPSSERAPKGGIANILNNKTTFPTLQLNQKVIQTSEWLGRRDIYRKRWQFSFLRVSTSSPLTIPDSPPFLHLVRVLIPHAFGSFFMVSLSFLPHEHLPSNLDINQLELFRF